MTVCPQCREFVNSQPIKPGGIFYCASRKWKDVDNCPVFKELCKMPTEERDPLLQEREKTHGSFDDHASITQQLKDVMKKGHNWNVLTTCQKETLEMIQHKIGRILAGRADFKDHWDDISGYAKLVSERCPS